MMSHKFLFIAFFISTGTALISQSVEIWNNQNNEPRIELLNPGENTFIGVGAGSVNGAGGTYNIAFGYHALQSNTERHENIAIGVRALQNNTDGEHNIAIGINVMYRNQGSYNIAIGDGAFQINRTGVMNCAIGAGALQNQTAGQESTAIGFGALQNNTTYIHNTAIGSAALQNNTVGVANTAIGRDADVSTNGLNDAIALGYLSEVDSSNKVRIGNSSVTSNGGQVSWTAYSDARIKDDIRENVHGLAFIKELQPVTYHFNVTRQNQLMGIDDTADWEGKYDIGQIQFSGFLAQDVETAALKVGYDFSGIDKSGEIMGLRYAEFTVPLVKSLQEMSVKVKDLETENVEFRLRLNDLDTLKAELEVIKSLIKSGNPNDK